MKISKKEILNLLNIEEYYQDHIKGRTTQSGDWRICRSPLREDKKPSFSFNIKNGAFKDFNGETGNIFKFDQLKNGGTEADAINRLAIRVGLDPHRKESLEEKVERYHDCLLTNHNGSLEFVRTLGVSENTIRNLKIGYMPEFGRHPARIIFPIYDLDGVTIVTLKKYSPAATPKCTFEKGGQNSLYGIHQINGNVDIPIVICAGEKDKTVGESFLGDRYTFVTFTAGEGSLPREEFLEKSKEALQNRNIIILYDADESGKNGALRVASEFLDIVQSVRIGEWPDEFSSQFPKGDVTDFLTKYNTEHSAENLINILQAAPIFEANNQHTEIIHQENKICENHNQCGSIIESSEGYYRIRTTKDGDIHTQISNFIIVPQQVIEIDNGTEIVKCKFVHENSEQATVFLEKKSWNSKKDFLEKLPSRKYWFAGADRDVQYIKGIVGNQDIPVTYATPLLGYKEKRGSKIYILPEKSFGQDQKNLVSFAPSLVEPPLQSIFTPQYIIEDKQSFLKSIIPTIYHIHEPMPLMSALGWFFATPFKPQIVKMIDHFPILGVSGTKGSGKTTLISRIWRLFGFHGEMFSVTLSIFSWIKILSSTNCFPICFDEFKTSDLNPMHVDFIKQTVRKLYTNTIETRGRQDQSLIKYPLQAPTVILGESLFQDTAILERLVPVSLSFRSLEKEQGEKYKINIRKLNKQPLQVFLPIYLEWCLQQNCEILWNTARGEIEKEIAKISVYVPERILDNMTIVAHGIYALSNFANSYNLPFPSFSPTEFVEYFLEEINEEKNTRIALDNLLEKLADMAERGEIIPDIDYKTEKDTVFLRLKQCVDHFRGWTFRHQYRGEALEYEAYRKMLKERISVYVQETRITKRFGGKPQKCISINVKSAVTAGIEIGGFLD